MLLALECSLGTFAFNRKSSPCARLYWGHVTTARHTATQQVDWEKPMIRCGIALAGDNHVLQITNALAKHGLRADTGGGILLMSAGKRCV